MTPVSRRVLSSAIVCFVAAVALAAPGGRHVLVRFARPLTALDRAELEAEGLTIQKPVAGGSFVALLHGNIRDERVVSLETLTAQHKTHGSAIREAAKGKSFAELDVVFHDDVTLDDALAAIDDAGGAPADPLTIKFRHGHRLRAKVPPSALQKLARDERVLTIIATPHRVLRPDNIYSAALSHVNTVNAAPYGLTGAGVTLSLFEIGRSLSTHPDFGGRLTTHTDEAFDSHATHTAGTIGGSRLGNPSAKGMAPAALIHEYVANDDIDITLAQKETQLAPLGVVADNNSWGYVLGWYAGKWYDDEEHMGAYDLVYAAPLDRIAIEQNVLFVHSAGNDAQPPSLPGLGQHLHFDTGAIQWCYSPSGLGGDCPPPCAGGSFCETTHHLADAPWRTIGNMESAKNILLVGAVDDYKGIASFSSRGPARDGRVKPELVARGLNVLSTVLNDSYGYKSGTSMAAPVVTGIAGLMAQQWRQTYGGASPTVAQLRTVLIAGAEDLWNPGPDYAYGFGLVDAKASADLIRDGNRIHDGSLAQGQSYELTMAVAAPQNLRVTLGWADPDIAYLGGSDIASPALVNDLDVQVIDAHGNITYPYVLDKDAPAVPATRGPNHVDNVEMVEIPSAAAGLYRIVVTATTIADASPQAFVVVSNAPAAIPTASFSLTATGSALAWTTAGTGATYDVYSNGALLAAGLTTTSYNDASAAADSAHIYRVLAHLTGAGLAWSNVDLATTFTPDATLAAGQPIRLAHIQRLETMTNAVRDLAGLAPIALTAPGIVRASHLLDLRNALITARTALALPAATFQAIAAGDTIRAADFTEIRDALQ